MLIVLEILSVCCNFLYLFFAIKQKPIAWIFGVIASLFSFFLFRAYHLNGSALLNIVYAIQGVFGFMQWKFIQKNNLPGFRLKVKDHLFLIGFTIALFFTTLLLFKSHLPLIVARFDLLLAFLCILTTFLEIKKETSCWLYWISLNILYTALYAYQNLYWYALLMLTLGLFSIWALKVWTKATSNSTIAANR